MIENKNNKLGVREQCELLAVPRQRLYYRPVPISSLNLSVMDFIDREFTSHPFVGVERMAEEIFRQMYIIVNHKRVRRLMRKMYWFSVNWTNAFYDELLTLPLARGF